jgi:peroxiredoxin family protein
MVLFSGDMDKALAALIIATGAAASGWDVSIFFTFWGFAILRDPNKKSKMKKDTMGKMFSTMLPKGADGLKLSKMNMLGLGTSMMKRRMSSKKVQSVRGFIKDANELGVKFLACDLSMELLGINADELIDEVSKVCGVGTFLEESKDANVSLFV